MLRQQIIIYHSFNKMQLINRVHYVLIVPSQILKLISSESLSRCIILVTVSYVLPQIHFIFQAFKFQVIAISLLCHIALLSMFNLICDNEVMVRYRRPASTWNDFSNNYFGTVWFSMIRVLIHNNNFLLRDSSDL